MDSGVSASHKYAPASEIHSVVMSGVSSREVPKLGVPVRCIRSWFCVCALRDFDVCHCASMVCCTSHRAGISGILRGTALWPTIGFHREWLSSPLQHIDNKPHFTDNGYGNASLLCLQTI